MTRISMWVFKHMHTAELNPLSQEGKHPWRIQDITHLSESLNMHKTQKMSVLVKNGARLHFQVKYSLLFYCNMIYLFIYYGSCWKVLCSLIKADVGKQKPLCVLLQRQFHLDSGLTESQNFLQFHKAPIFTVNTFLSLVS